MFRALRRIPIHGSFGMYNRTQSRTFTDLAKSLASTPSRIAIVYGSETGNVERLAKQLHDEFKWRFNESVLLTNAKHQTFQDLGRLDASDTVLLLTSTYGQGGPNENTQALWDTVFGPNPPSLTFNYSVLSRGSSLYEKSYALAGLRLDQQFNDLGAHRVSPVGTQDFVGPDPEEEYFNWKEQVMQYLIKTRGYTERPYNYKPATTVTETPNHHEAATEIFHQSVASTPVEMQIEATQLARTDREYIFAKVQLPQNISYETGDHLVIWPENSKPETDIFLDAVFGDSERRHHMLHVHNRSRIVKTSYERLARHTIDINGRAERALLLKLAIFAPTDEVKQRTLELVVDKAKYQAVTQKINNFNLARLLKWLSPNDPWISKMPPSALFDVLPHLLPRKYSISSSSKECPTQVTLTAVSVVDNALGFKGLATSQLSSLIGKQGQKIMAAIEPSPMFRLPPDPSTAILMFAVGTGVAPFRGFIRERVLSHAAPSILFVGCRTPSDLPHRKEFLGLESHNNNFNFKLIPAYSRIDVTQPNKGYITHRMAENKEMIWDHIQNGAHFYICGDVRVSKTGIQAELAGIFAEKMGISVDEAEQEIMKLFFAGKIGVEFW